MTRSAKIAALMAATLTLALTAQATAGHCHRSRPIVIHPPVVHLPVIYPQPVIQPAPRPIITRRPIVIEPQNAWYFGMSVQLINTQYGLGVQVYSIAPGGPAYQAGLEAGDVMLEANGVSLSQVRSNQDAVRLLQSVVSSNLPVSSDPVSAGPVSTGPVQTFSLASNTTVAPRMGNVLLTVLDIRTGDLTKLTLLPEAIGSGPGPIPTLSQPNASQPNLSRPAPTQALPTLPKTPATQEAPALLTR